MRHSSFRMPTMLGGPKIRHTASLRQGSDVGKRNLCISILSCASSQLTLALGYCLLRGNKNHRGRQSRSFRFESGGVFRKPRSRPPGRALGGARGLCPSRRKLWTFVEVILQKLHQIWARLTNMCCFFGGAKAGREI